jgi:hypothetical protein
LCEIQLPKGTYVPEVGNRRIVWQADSGLLADPAIVLRQTTVLDVLLKMRRRRVG